MNFIVQLPKKNEDYFGSYKNKLIQNVLTRFPWLTTDATSAFKPKGYDISYAGPEDGIEFGKKNSIFDVNFSPNKYVNDLKYYNALTGNTEPRIYDLKSEFDVVMNRIEEYARRKTSVKPTYDFYLGDIPCKVHDGFLQVGYDIVPKGATLLFFQQMPVVKRRLVYKAVIELSTYLAA